VKLYLDASAIIYSIESTLPLRQAVLSRITEVEREPNGQLLTSRLSRLECRVRPLRERETRLLETYEGFFALASLRVIEITADVIERATELRVRYGLKTPDAIHLATAIELQADAVLTGDRDLARCTDVKVETL
jgi:predicted nucleic acid-binding protein